MIKTGTIEYQLLINEENKHGVNYKSSLEGDLAALLITAESLEQQLESAKDLKTQIKDAKRRTELNKTIMLYKRGLAAVNSLSQSLCDNYEQYILTIGAMELMAKEEQSLQDSKENESGENLTNL